MISRTVAKIEAAIKKTRGGRREDKDEVIVLLRKLKDEVKALDEAQKEQARRVASFVEAAVKLSGPPKVSHDVLKAARAELSRLETAHPQLVGALNKISEQLAALGI
jgi:flagellar motor component MotA